MMKMLLVLPGFWLFLTVSVYAGKSITVDLSTQTATAYENGVPVFSGHISTGTAKRPTPTGHFRVLEKDIDHVSTSWPKPNGGAKMHYMLRLTSYGIAMHLGFVPNYPASHGCIRLENGFAQRMYSWAHVGVPVRVVGHAPARVYRTIAKKVTPKKPSRKKLTALEVFSASPKVGARASSQRKKATVAHRQYSSTAKKSARSVSYSRPSTLDLLSSSHKVAKRSTVAVKKKNITAKKKPVPAISYGTPSTLDILSASPKAAKRVNAAQKEKWKKRPKRKAPKVDPLKAVRA